MAWQGPCSALSTFPRRSQHGGREEKAGCDCPRRPAPGGRMAGSTLTRSLGRKLGSCCRTAIGPHFEARAVVDPRRPLFSSLSAESAAARGSVRVPRAEDRAKCQGPSEVRHLPAPGRPRPPPACAQRVLPGPPSSQQPLGGTGTGKTPCPAAGPAPPAERARWPGSAGGRKGAQSRGEVGTRTPNRRRQGLLCCPSPLASGLR